MHVQVLYVVYLRRLFKDAGALYLAFAMLMRSGEMTTSYILASYIHQLLLRK